MKLASIIFLISFSAMASNEIKLEKFRIDLGPTDRQVENAGYIDRRDTLTGDCSMSGLVYESGDGYIRFMDSKTSNWINFRHSGDDVYLNFAEIGVANYDKCKTSVHISENMKIGSIECKDGINKLKVIITTDLNGALKNVFTQYRFFGASECFPIPMFSSGKMNCGL